MTERPNHNTVAGKRYLALRALARSAGRPTAELLQLYVLEGFLARLERSGQRERLVLKGGALLSAFDLRRPTRDIDFLALSTPNDAAAVRSLVVGIANEALNDGLSFNLEDVSTETIREGDAYTGVRTSIRATLATARLHFHVDVNVGDPIWPGSQRVFVPRLLSGEAIELEGYPLAMVLAEKVVTAIQRGEANTRWRDFADVLLIAAKHPVAGADFHSALTRVASFCRTPPPA